MSSVPKRAGLAAGAIALLCLAQPSQARELKANFSEDGAAAMQAGDYMWSADNAAAEPVRIIVSLPLQRAYVFRGRTMVAMSTVSTGRDGHETPVGDFPILEKDADHRSNLYNDARMPWMLRLTWDGIAIHAGRNPGYPASHGCIRAPASFAKKLFAMTEKGALVTVTDQAIDPLTVADPIGLGTRYATPEPIIAAADTDSSSAPMLRRITYSSTAAPDGY